MRDIQGYEGIYAITSCGKVWSYKVQRFLKSHIDKYGYKNIVLFKNGKQKNFKVHRLVAMAYIPNDDNKPQINHKDECKQNNYVNNLEWVTPHENNTYGTRLAKLEKPVTCIETKRSYKSAREAGRITGVCAANIIRCCNNVRKTAGGCHWEYVR